MPKKNMFPFAFLVLFLIALGVALLILIKPDETTPSREPYTIYNSESKYNLTTEYSPSTSETSETTLYPSETKTEYNHSDNENPSVPEDAQKIGFFIGSESDMEPEILEAYQKEGCTVLNNVIIPESPETIPVYIATNKKIDAVQFMKAVFGDTVKYETQILAGEQGTLYTTAWHGAEYSIMDKGEYRDGYHRISVRRTNVPSTQTVNDPEGEAFRFAENLTLFPYCQGFNVESQAYYSYLFQSSLIICRQFAGTYPIASASYHIEEENDTWTILGTSLTVEFDAYGLSGVDLKRPLYLTETGEKQNIQISAETAMENAIKQAKKRFSGHNVIAIRGISLEYLAPAHDGEPMIPVWVIPYDIYRSSLQQGSVELDVGELSFLVDAVTGEVFPIYV